jgi:hypothetical protein
MVGFEPTFNWHVGGQWAVGDFPFPPILLSLLQNGMCWVQTEIQLTRILVAYLESNRMKGSIKSASRDMEILSQYFK